MKVARNFLLPFLVASGLMAASPDRPDFGVILNDDGDLSFVSPDPAKSEAFLRANIDGDADLGIGTLVYCVGAGSDVLNYPTKAGSPTGWRTTSVESGDAVWAYRLNNARAAIAAGMDAVRIAGEQAKKNGLRFLPSLRMNDSHFMKDPFNYPLTGEFWMKNHAALRIKDSPLAFEPDYANLFNFAHEEVRAHRLAVIDEIIARNKHIIDGFELDFNRVQVFFPKDKAAEGAPLMTDLVRKVRQRLDQLEAETGRPMFLFARIPPSLDACRRAGLEVEAWMKEGLVDLVSPAQLMTLAHDMPIRDLIEKAHASGTLVYPSLYPRTSWRAPLDFLAPDLGLTAAADRSATKEEILAAAANYREMGADGFYLFNFYGADAGSRPYPDWMHGLVAGLRRKTPDAGTKIFAVTKTYYKDDVEPSYAYVKQLPARVDGAKSFSIEIGELPGDTPFPLKKCVLRLGTNTPDTAAPGVALNGHALTLWKTFRPAKTAKKFPPDAATTTLVYVIDDPGLLRRGANEITVSGTGVSVTDLEVGLAYNNQLSALLFQPQNHGQQTPKEEKNDP